MRFEEYVAARWMRLVRSAVLLGIDRHAAEDVVQGALAKCYEHWVRIERSDDIDAYVHRVLINTLISSRRRRWWNEVPAEILPDIAIADTSGASDERDALQRALNRLPLAQRQVLVLRFYSDLTEQQTARVLGIALGTVKSRTARAISILESDLTLRDPIGEES